MFLSIKEKLAFWQIVVLTALFAVTLGVVVPPAEAAKTVPTIRIEIPKKATSEGSDSTPEKPQKTAPAIPLSDEDLAPSIDKLDEESFPDADDADKNGDIDEDAAEASVPVKIHYGEEGLPDAVKALRKQLLDIAYSGEIEKLRPLFETFEQPPLLSFDDEGDPIEFLKSSSGDGEGREILAILLEVLESGYVRRDENDDGDIFIWPYFVQVPPDDLTSRQIVELFRVITAGDFEDMKAYGTYIFYRVGITPDGQLKFFIAGD